MVLDHMPSWFKTMAYALAISTGFELLYYLKAQKEAKTKSEKKDEEIDVVFFPDLTVACDAHFSYGCKNKACWLSHEETSSMKVMNYLEKAERSLDICVYCIASQALVDSVLKAHDSGIVVRVLTDQAQCLEQATQSQIGRLRAAGKFSLSEIIISGH